MRTPIILGLSLFCVGYIWADSVEIDTSVVRDVRSGDLVNGEIHPGLPQRTFRLVANEETNTIQKIEVFLPDQKEPVQVIEAEQAESPYRDSKYFKIVDIDFDGYQDIGLLSWWGKTGNEGWKFWRFDPASGKFVQDKLISELPHPEFDPKTKTIKTFTRGDDCQSTTTFYTYQRGKLHIEKAERCNLSQDEPPQCECHPLERL